METKYWLPVILVATLAFGSFTVMAFENKSMKGNNKMLGLSIQKNTVNTEELKANIPEQATVEKELTAISNPRRFILWTHDGIHVMWGSYGNGYFKGEDNDGKYTWGIYGNKVFAGFYDGKFFWGRYAKDTWKSEGLFGLDQSHGRYVTFSLVHPTPIIEDAAE